MRTQAESILKILFERQAPGTLVTEENIETIVNAVRSRSGDKVFASAAAAQTALDTALQTVLHDSTKTFTFVNNDEVKSMFHVIDGLNLSFRLNSVKHNQEGYEMAFVNEYIPEADKQKYQITDHSNFYRAGAGQWTVDREREMFLVYRGGYGSEGRQDEKFWVFYWRGYMLDVHLHNLAVSQDLDGNVHSRKRIIQIRGMTPDLERSRPDIIDDLACALSVYGVAGLLIPVKSYNLELEDK